jgi:hypothetical protein
MYNQQSLRVIRYVESQKDWEPAKKLGQLVEINEARLSPYVFRRFNVLWDKVFETMGSEDEKVQAVKHRILRTKE